MYTPRKPAYPPSIFRILLNDWALAPVVLLGLWFLIGLYALLTSLESDSGAWQFFAFYFFIPMMIAVLCLLWRVHQRVRYIRGLWAKGEIVVGEVKSVSYCAHSGRFVHYHFTCAGRTYNKALGLGPFQESPLQIVLIVNPEKPNEVIVLDSYF
jgi:hypothetical protein